MKTRLSSQCKLNWRGQCFGDFRDTWNERGKNPTAKSQALPSPRTLQEETWVMSKYFSTNQMPSRDKQLGRREEINIGSFRTSQNYSLPPWLRELTFILLTFSYPSPIQGVPSESFLPSSHRAALGMLLFSGFKWQLAVIKWIGRISAWLTFCCYWFAQVPARELISWFGRMLGFNGYQTFLSPPRACGAGVLVLTHSGFILLSCQR